MRKRVNAPRGGNKADLNCAPTLKYNYYSFHELNENKTAFIHSNGFLVRTPLRASVVAG